MKHPRINAIPDPRRDDFSSLHETTVALKSAIEIIVGQRGQGYNHSPTWQDLIDIGLITADQVPK